MAKVFIVGGTGHTGGAVLDLILRKHPQLIVKVMVRDEDKATRLKENYASVQTVLGDLSCLQILQDEARNADIVVNDAPDITHADGIQAILAGLKDANRQQKGFYVHLSGAADFYTKDPNGLKEGRIWDDVADIDEILSLEQSYTHVATENLVRSASEDVNVAILSPVGIGGISPSVEHPVPLTTDPLVRTARAFGSGFQVGEGQNEVGWVHVLDLARAHLLLIDKALEALSGGAESMSVWGPQAYYFVRTEDISFHDLQAALVPVLHRCGVIPLNDIKSVTHTDMARTLLAGSTEYDADAPLPPLDSWMIHIATAFGVNMRVRSERLRALGWQPLELSVLKDWEAAVQEFLKREGGVS